ncbi:MAG: nuclear transport factor 2 family protein [Candidatus Dadabacteria bacterium]|nr:nuclear transport factor 2 family protein [Candidatus Dadabacteria bacterium]
MSEKNVSIIRGMYEAFNSGDHTSAIAPLHPEVVWQMAENFVYAGPKPKPKIGPEEVLKGFMRLVEEWEDFAVTPDELLDAGDTVVAKGYYTGTYRKSGKKVRAQFAHFYDLRKGRVVRFQQYTDTAQFIDVVGG